MDRNIENYVKHYDLLSVEECQKTIEQLQNLDWAKHKFYSPSTEDYVINDNDPSVPSGDFEMKKIITDKLWHCIKKHMSEGLKECSKWYGGWNGYTFPRFTRYTIGNSMHVHCDHIHDIFDGQRKGVPVLTVLGILNNDYKGGELVMWDDTVINFKVGEVIIFPSNFMYPHEVKPVTEGTRYSFVSWVW